MPQGQAEVPILRHALSLIGAKLPHDTFTIILPNQGNCAAGTLCTLQYITASRLLHTTWVKSCYPILGLSVLGKRQLDSRDDLDDHRPIASGTRRPRLMSKRSSK